MFWTCWYTTTSKIVLTTSLSSILTPLPIYGNFPITIIYPVYLQQNITCIRALIVIRRFRFSCWSGFWASFRVVWCHALIWSSDVCKQTWKVSFWGLSLTSIEVHVQVNVYQTSLMSGLDSQYYRLLHHQATSGQQREALSTEVS